MFFIPYLATKYVSLGSLVLYLGIFLQIAVEGKKGFFGVPGSMYVEMMVILGILTIMAWYRHRENIGRLMRGEERRFSVGKDKGGK